MKNGRTFSGSPFVEFNFWVRLRFCQSGAGLVLKCVFRDVDQFSKCRCVLRRDISQNFPVERTFRGFQAFHETAVSQAGGTRCGVDSDLPEVAERALFDATVAIGVLAAVVNGIGRVSVKFGALEAEAL